MALSSYVINTRKVIMDRPILESLLQKLAIEKTLPYTCLHQEQTEWCWVAVTAAVNGFYGRTLQQCDIANNCLDQSTCCVDGSSAACNTPWYLNRSLSDYNSLNAMTAGKMEFASVQSEIDNSNPVCLRIGWNGGGGHFVAVYGYNSTDEYITIGDPWFGVNVRDYNTFPTQYHAGGTWTTTYTTKHF
ncbi:MAG TPA: C39 family peptidase [Bacteroidia bacterium]|nr:C39 family peptidase [Bacteroidia bacterium]